MVDPLEVWHDWPDHFALKLTSFGQLRCLDIDWRAFNYRLHEDAGDREVREGEADQPDDQPQGQQQPQGQDEEQAGDGVEETDQGGGAAAASAAVSWSSQLEELTLRIRSGAWLLWRAVGLGPLPTPHLTRLVLHETASLCGLCGKCFEDDQLNEKHLPPFFPEQLRGLSCLKELVLMYRVPAAEWKLPDWVVGEMSGLRRLALPGIISREEMVRDAGCDWWCCVRDDTSRSGAASGSRPDTPAADAGAGAVRVACPDDVMERVQGALPVLCGMLEAWPDLQVLRLHESMGPAVKLLGGGVPRVGKQVEVYKLHWADW